MNLIGHVYKVNASCWNFDCPFQRNSRKLACGQLLFCTLLVRWLEPAPYRDRLVECWLTTQPSLHTTGGGSNLPWHYWVYQYNVWRRRSSGLSYLHWGMLGMPHRIYHPLLLQNTLWASKSVAVVTLVPRSLSLNEILWVMLVVIKYITTFLSPSAMQDT